MFSFRLLFSFISFSVMNKSAEQYPSWTIPNTYGNRWIYVAITYNSINYDSSDAKIYINGISTTPIFTANGYDSNFRNIQYESTHDVYIGMRNFSDGKNFNGTIDDVRIYDRALTLKEVQMLYNNETDMIDEGTTTTADNWSACITPNDATGDGSTLCSNNLTIVAATSDTSAPSFSGSVNNTLFKRYFNASMNLTITDDTDISNYTFSWNESGSFVNDTSVQLAGTQTTWDVNISKNVTNALYNQIVQWRVYSCDSSNNCNTSAGD